MTPTEPAEVSPAPAALPASPPTPPRRTRQRPTGLSVAQYMRGDVLSQALRGTSFARVLARPLQLECTPASGRELASWDADERKEHAQLVRQAGELADLYDAAQESRGNERRAGRI